MYQGIATKCLTGVVRLSYAHLNEPYSNNGGEAKYGVTLLIPKSDVATKADFDAAIESAAQNGTRDKWNGVRPPVLAIPLYDGDGVRPSGEAFGEECKGHWVITASSKTKPEVVHVSNINVPLAPTDVYSGMFARVTVNFFAYNANGKKGIGCGLGNVLKIDDGEPLGGHTNAATDFGDVAVQTVQQPMTSQAAAQPVYPQYQQPMPQQPVPQIDPITGQPVGSVYGM